MQNNYHISTKSWPDREKPRSIRPVDNSDKPSYGFTCGSLSDRASDTWIRPVTDRSWWFKKFRKNQHAVAVITAGTQDQQRFNYQLGTFFTWRPVLLHLPAGCTVIAGKHTIMSPADAGYGLMENRSYVPAVGRFRLICSKLCLFNEHKTPSLRLQGRRAGLGDTCALGVIKLVYYIPGDRCAEWNNFIQPGSALYMYVPRRQPGSARFGPMVCRQIRIH